MKFCPKCGVSVKDEAQFCNKCGYDFNLKESQNTQNDSSNSEEEVEEETPAFKYTLSGTNKKILLGSVIAAVLIIAFVFTGKMLSNPKRTVMVFENAVNKDNAEMISKVLYSSDGRLKFTSDGVKPLIQAFKTTPSEFTDVISNLNNQASNLKNGGVESKTSSLYITRSGRMMLFFTKYKIAVNPVFLTVTSGVKGADILIDGQKVAVTDSENFSRQLGPYLPGLYNVEGKAKGAFGEMDNITKVDFIKDKKQNKTVNALEGIYVQVNSGYNNNKVYINGKDTGKSVNSGDKIGPVASGASIYGVINYNG